MAIIGQRSEATFAGYAREADQRWWAEDGITRWERNSFAKSR
jgi:hypothetical protein